MPGDEAVQVAETFEKVARVLAAHRHLDATLNAIVQLAVENLNSCEHAGISLVQKGKIASPAASSDVPKKVDEIQEETEQGPCVDAIKEHEVFTTGDLETERRWPDFSSRAHAETGVRSIVSFRLFIEDETMGALNLYSSEQNAFDVADMALGSVFAAHAAVAMSSARREDELEKKAATRDLIGRAKGILMAQSGVTDEQAFEMLKSASQRMNVKLRDVAKQITERTSLPGDR